MKHFSQLQATVSFKCCGQSQMYVLIAKNPPKATIFHFSTPKMNGTSQESQPVYPIISSPTSKEAGSFHRTMSSDSLPSNSHHVSFSSQPPYEESTEKWGTRVMGTPAVPTCHPDNKKAALWGASDDEAQQFHHPYLQYSPIEKSSGSSKESILQVFNSWGNKAETMAHNIWHNLRTDSSVPRAAWGKMNLTAKAITEGGFESLYKQTFTSTNPNEKLKKTFACYLSTTTGPVAGTLYLTDAHAAFCSDRPLSFKAPSGQESWSYYKIMIPLSKIGTINPIVMRENQSEKYIEIVTTDGHDFWFMGFVNFGKASRHLTESISSFVGRIAAEPILV